MSVLDFEINIVCCGSDWIAYGCMHLIGLMVSSHSYLPHLILNTCFFLHTSLFYFSDPVLVFNEIKFLKCDLGCLMDRP